MGQPKLTPLAAAIKAAEQLSDEEKQTLRDVLRPAPKPRSKPKSERKPSQKRKAGKEPDLYTGGWCLMVNCGKPFDDNVHHRKSDSGYHEFIPADENRVVSSTKAAMGGGQ